MIPYSSEQYVKIIAGEHAGRIVWCEEARKTIKTALINLDGELVQVPHGYLENSSWQEFEKQNSIDP